MARAVVPKQYVPDVVGSQRLAWAHRAKLRCTFDAPRGATRAAVGEEVEHAVERRLGHEAPIEPLANGARHVEELSGEARIDRLRRHALLLEEAVEQERVLSRADVGDAHRQLATRRHDGIARRRRQRIECALGDDEARGDVVEL